MKRTIDVVAHFVAGRTQSTATYQHEGGHACARPLQNAVPTQRPQPTMRAILQLGRHDRRFCLEAQEAQRIERKPYTQLARRLEWLTIGLREGAIKQLMILGRKHHAAKQSQLTHEV